MPQEIPDFRNLLVHLSYELFALLMVTKKFDSISTYIEHCLWRYPPIWEAANKHGLLKREVHTYQLKPGENPNQARPHRQIIHMNMTADIGDAVAVIKHTEGWSELPLGSRDKVVAKVAIVGDYHIDRYYKLEGCQQFVPPHCVRWIASGEGSIRQRGELPFQGILEDDD